MARFVAKFARYRHGIRTGRFMVLADGQRQELTKELYAKFDRAIPTEEEQNIGIKELIHHGLPLDRDTEEHFSPRSRISGFDTYVAQQTYGWTDDERELVEFTLRNSAFINDEFIEVTQAPAAKPWPAYDSVETPEKIVALATELGLDLKDVIAYELENRNAAPVVNALEAALEVKTEDKDEVVLIQA